MTEVALKAETPLSASEHGLSTGVETSHTDQVEQRMKHDDKKWVSQKQTSFNLIDQSDSQIKNYFKSKMHKITNHKKVINELMSASERSVDLHFLKGSLVISEESCAIQELLAPQIKTNRQMEKIHKIINRKKELQFQLKKVSEQLKLSGNQKDTLSNNNNAIQAQFSTAEHKQFVERMMKVRKVSQQKRRLAAQYTQKKNLQYLKKLQEQMLSRQARQREQKKKGHKQKLQQIEKRRQKQKEEEKESIRRFKSVAEQKRIYQLMEEKYQASVVLPLLEERKKTLEERKKKLEGFSIEEIRTFQREHVKMLEQRQTCKSRQEQNWHYKPPPCSPRLLQLLQEQKIQQKLKQEQKKRALQQKKCRQESFLQFLKERIPIKIDQSKKEELEKLMQKQPQRQRSESQKRSMGNSYMIQAKSRVKQLSKDKKQSQSMKDEKKDKTQGDISNISTPSKRKSSLIELQNKKLDQLISSDNIESSQKLFKLKVEIEKMGEKAKRKQQMDKLKNRRQKDEDDLDELLSSIKAKVGIMEIYSK